MKAIKKILLLKNALMKYGKNENPRIPLNLQDGPNLQKTGSDQNLNLCLTKKDQNLDLCLTK